MPNFTKYNPPRTQRADEPAAVERQQRSGRAHHGPRSDPGASAEGRRTGTGSAIETAPQPPSGGEPENGFVRAPARGPAHEARAETPTHPDPTQPEEGESTGAPREIAIDPANPLDALEAIAATGNRRFQGAWPMGDGDRVRVALMTEVAAVQLRVVERLRDEAPRWDSTGVRHVVETWFIPQAQEAAAAAARSSRRTTAGSGTGSFAGRRTRTAANSGEAARLTERFGGGR